MEKVRQINIKYRTYYFHNGQINLKCINAKMLKIHTKNYKKIDVYYIGYVIVKQIDNCNNINSVNPLYLMIDKMIGDFECNSVEEKSENKYLVLDDDIDENKEILKKYKKSLGRCYKRN